MINEFVCVLSNASEDHDLRLIIITGSQGHFCAGRELGEGAERDLATVLKYDDAYARIFRLLHRSSVPSLAIVDGYAVAGGFSLAMGCDFVFATESAQFGALEMKHGFPAAINTALLSHFGMPKLVLEWLITGELLPAQRLYDVGLVNRLLPDAETLRDEAESFITALLHRDPLGVRLAREAFYQSLDMSLAESLGHARNRNALLLASGRIDSASNAFRRNRNRSADL